MKSIFCKTCGGCAFRNLSLAQYRENKFNDFKKTLQKINMADPCFDDPIFIEDGVRRRAELDFTCTENQVRLGFNEEKTHNLVDITQCAMLDSTLNAILEPIRNLLQELSAWPISIKNKKKIEKVYIHHGSVQLLHADNGIDILLQIPTEPSLEHRLAVADFVNTNPNVCRLSWMIGKAAPEIIIEKVPPELYIADTVIAIPPKVFLQASKAAETAMIEKVLAYLGETKGKIADLFCGLGTFTYPLAQIKGCTVVAADSSESSLAGMQKALNHNQIKNVTVVNRNLFKYPFDASDLKDMKAIVLDPPRAGAHQQCREISLLPAEARPQKIIYVSCNPQTFTYDAELLLKAGYAFKRVTFVDQFVYSKHQELIALFQYNHKE